MHDMRKTLAKPCGKPGEGDDILRPGIALYRAGPHAQRKAARNPREGGFHALTDPSTVEKDSNFMTARGLFASQVDHVAEETAERSAENMRDSQFLDLHFTRRHCYTPTLTLPESETNPALPREATAGRMIRGRGRGRSRQFAPPPSAQIHDSSPAGNFLGENLRNHCKGTVH
jgi:hypothetical protein